MSKPKVQKAPPFHFDRLDFPKLSKYFDRYDITDEKGRYLHWDQLRWRVPSKEAHDIWQTVKFKRAMQIKTISLTSEEGVPFTYCTPHSMEALLHQIVKLAGGNVGAIADTKAPDSIQLRFLVSSLIMEEAITSAQLEGAATTREVAKKMLEEDREPVNEDERMILNNYLLLRYAEQHSNDPLTLDMILEFHRIATNKTTENNVNPGEFRNSNDIFVDDGQGGIAHTPPNFELIPERLEKLCIFANTDHSGLNGNEFIAPVIKAIILHFMIGYEHPFRDGNGRTARALFYWFMLKSEYSLFKYISISKLLKEKPKDYGVSFLYTELDGFDLTYFIYFQLEIILSAFDELKNYLNKKSEDFQKITELLANSKFADELNFIQKDIIKKGSKEPGRIFTAKEISNSYSIAENTARTYLNKLVELKLFFSSKDGRTILYISPSDLNAKLTSK